MKQTTRLVALALLAGLLLAAVPPAQAQAAEVWVCPSGSCAGTPSFTTIQAAINEVSAGGTVHVAAGTYTGSLAIGKALTLEGAGASSCEVRGALDIGAAGVTVRGLKFAGPVGSGSGDGYIIRLSGANNAVLEDCTLASLSNYANSYGLLIANTTGAAGRRLTLSSISASGTAAAVLLDAGAHGNSFETLAINSITSITSSSGSAYGVRLAAAVQNNSFTGLTIAGLTAASGGQGFGISVNGGSGQLFSAIDVSTLQGYVVRAISLEGASSATVRGLRFDRTGSTASSNIEGVYAKAGGSGIVVEASEVANATRGVLVDGGSVTVRNCTFAGNTSGVLVRSGTTAVLRDNAIAGNATGIDNSAGGSVDATGNWWGSPTGPKTSNPGGTGDSFAGTVTFSPWLGDGTDTSPDRGFQPNPLRYGIATRLAFSTQPGNATVGQPLSPQPVVQAQDAAGNLGYNYQQAVTVSLATNPAGGTLTGTKVVTATHGTAAFTNLAIDKIGSGYTLSATALGLTAATSASFDVRALPPVLAGLSPDHATAGSGPLSLAVSGTGFAPEARVQWNGATRPTTYTAATALMAQVEAADLATPGTAAVTVLNPDGQTSNGLAFTIRPQPAEVWVDARWASLAAEADPDGDGPASHMGYDAFADVQAAMGAVARGGAVHIAPGAYAGGLVVDTDGLTIELNGATIGAGSPAFTVTADDVTIQNGVLDGTGDATGASAIVVAAGVARLWVHDCEIKNWPADGVHLSGAVDGLKIMDNTIHDNRGDGIELNGTPTGTVVVTGNSLRNNGGYGIHAVSGSLSAEYNEWGHIDGPAAGDGVSGAVDADPWLFAQLAAHVVADPSQVNEGEAVDVEVRASAANLSGAQFTLTYDPARLEVVGITTAGAGYFAGTLGAKVVRDDAAGLVRYSAALQAGEPPLNGQATLLSVRFRARAVSGVEATTAIDIEAGSVGLAAPGGVRILPLSVSGDSVTIVGTTAVSGVVRLQGRGDWSGARVDAGPGATYGDDPAAATTDAWGRYAFSATNDHYAIAVTMARYLGARTEVDVAGGSQTLAAVELLGGDVNDDGRVSMTDITAISGLLFGSAVDAATTAADINYDGWVDILDLALAAGNYDLSGSPWVL